MDGRYVLNRIVACGNLHKLSGTAMRLLCAACADLDMETMTCKKSTTEIRQAIRMSKNQLTRDVKRLIDSGILTPVDGPKEGLRTFYVNLHPMAVTGSPQDRLRRRSASRRKLSGAGTGGDVCPAEAE